MLEDQAAGGSWAQAHRRFRLDAQAGGTRFDDKQGWARSIAVELGGDKEQLVLSCTRNERLDAVQHKASAGGALRAGGQSEGIEQGLRLQEGERCSWRVIRDELVQVPRLLLSVTPEADSGRDSKRRQAGEGHSQIPLGERLRYQRRGDSRPLPERAAQLLRDPDRGEPEFVCLRKHLVRDRASCISRRGGGPQALQRKVAHRVAQHLLLLGGGQIEQGAGAGPRLAHGVTESRGGRKRAAGPSRGAGGRAGRAL